MTSSTISKYERLEWGESFHFTLTLILIIISSSVLPRPTKSVFPIIWAYKTESVYVGHDFFFAIFLSEISPKNKKLSIFTVILEHFVFKNT